MNLFVDMTKLSDSDIQDKATLLNQRLNIARNCGLPFNILIQMEELLQTYQEELGNRAMVQEEKVKVSWDMEKYLEDNYELNNPKEQEDLQQWESDAIRFSGDDSDIGGCGSFLD